MRELEEILSTIQMIEDGYLITRRQIEAQYGLTREQVEEAVKYGDLGKVRFTGKDYFLDRQVEMLRGALEEAEEI